MSTNSAPALPSAEDINIPQPNDGACSILMENIPCRMYVRYHKGQDPKLGSERTNYLVGLEIWGYYGPRIGVVMRVGNAWFGHTGFAARYRDKAADRFFPNPSEAVKWVKEQRNNDPDRTDNGLRDTNGGRDT